jgi:hypothetical protein
MYYELMNQILFNTLIRLNNGLTIFDTKNIFTPITETQISIEN